ncbi:unnamed protein product [Chondrus crispus]|uniref:Signal recognition particle subunit SRP72 n=1 Tax=Chondrus crispus TaxID=2769 RepID=R7QSM7_CHOCR|nr:unnamed protein product [Chondrus crispus]CDF41139.1 unnamed protein product [Chondrus crispus]|eukprot:XP_005711433.1 unnamed protein product [Chondrus crispus]
MSTPSLAPLAKNDQLRDLFLRGEHDAVVTRCDLLLNRKKLDQKASRTLLQSIRFASLLHSGRIPEASTAATAIPYSPSLVFARHYLAWASADLEAASSSVQIVHNLPGSDARKLEAQLLYRSGSYAESASIFSALLAVTRNDLEDARRPASTSRWRLPGLATAPEKIPLTRAELDLLRDAVNELATNATAAFVLAGKPDDALAIVRQVGTWSKETRKATENEGGLLCGHYDGDRKAKAIVLAQTEEEVEEDEEDEEDAGETEEIMAPIRVQMAYLTHLKGGVQEAEKLYADAMRDRNADPASLAVAANNLTVALGQLAFGKRNDSAEISGTTANGPSLPKEQHEALVEGLKKMRATSGRTVERKLALNQRRAMAANRAVLLVQMGRYDACRAELAKLKTEFPKEALVPLIEASLVAKQGNLRTADSILTGNVDDSEVVRAARVQLLAASGDLKGAATLLQDLFRGRSAALVTAAGLFEQSGDIESATSLLSELVKKSSGADALSAKTALSSVLLRNAKYEEAAGVLREVCNANPSDSVAQAQLVVATSYFDATEAERAALLLPSSMSTQNDIDAKKLEALPPPKRRDIAARQNTTSTTTTKADEDDIAAKNIAVRERKKKKRKKRLPKNYDPEGPPPDPERWLPKTLRSGYKRKKAKDQNNFRGSQGADAAAADAAAMKNAEKSTAKASATAAEGPLPPSGRAKLRKKKGRR